LTGICVHIGRELGLGVLIPGGILALK